MTWQRTRLKHVAACNQASLGEDTDVDFTFDYVDISSVTQGYIADELEQMTFGNAPSRARRLADAGDSIVSTVRTYLRAAAVVDDRERHRVFSTGFAVLKPRANTESRFLGYLIQSDAVVDRVCAMSTGVSYPAITAKQLMDLDVDLPRVEVQVAIADFLDRETAKIDSLIDKQRLLRELASQRRRAFITSVVTRGTSQARMVPTGNVYYPLAPEGWIVSRMGLEMSINSGMVDPMSEDASSMILLAPDHIEPHTGRILGLVTAGDQSAESGKYRVRAGQLVYSKIRPALNKVAIASEDCLCSADMYAMTSLKRDAHRFLMYWMLSDPFLAFTVEASARVKMPKINREQLSSAPWPRPPLDEQLKMVSVLERELASIDSLIASIERHIALAHERRAALITAAVTGQLDIGGAA